MKDFRQFAIKQNLRLRALLIQAVRSFFIEKDYLEVETPCFSLLQLSALEFIPGLYSVRSMTATSVPKFETRSAFISFSVMENT